MRRFLFCAALAVLFLMQSCQKKPVNITIVGTSDIETAFFSYDYKRGLKRKGGIPSLVTYLNDLRQDRGDDGVIYIDNGDILNTWPLGHYIENFDTLSQVLPAEIMNLLKCDIYTLGESDLSTPASLNRYIKDSKASLICANILDKKSGEPLYSPYKVLQRQGVKIAILGMTNADAANYLSPGECANYIFEDIEKSAQKWVKIIKEKENPDIVIGLFHSGAPGGKRIKGNRENASLSVAENVPGFDAIICGHDGFRRAKTVKNSLGDDVLVLSPGRSAQIASTITITGELGSKGLENKKIEGKNNSLVVVKEDSTYNEQMRQRMNAVNDALSTTVCYTTSSIDMGDALYGSSAYVDLIHRVQLQSSDAQISFAHPFGYKGVLYSGAVKIGSLWGFYSLDSRLYTVKMSGAEIKQFLNYSYGEFYNLVSSKGAPVIKMNENTMGLAKDIKSLESAAGLRYEVLLNKSKGEGRINILGMSNGEKFDDSKEYLVAMGEDYLMNVNMAMNVGANVSKEELQKRIVSISDREMCQLFYDYLSKTEKTELKPLNNWKLLPSAWIDAVKSEELKLLRGDAANEPSEDDDIKL